MENEERNRIRKEFLEEMVDAMERKFSTDPDFVMKFITLGESVIDSSKPEIDSENTSS